jgi:hypothetical protein
MAVVAYEIPARPQRNMKTKSILTAASKGLAIGSALGSLNAQKILQIWHAKRFTLFGRVLLLNTVCLLCFTAVSRAESHVVAWGSNSYGQTNVPADLGAVVAISAGDRNNMALRTNGTAVVWGDNSYSQTNVPPDLTNLLALATGSGFCSALKADGTVIAWGANNNKQTNVPPDLTNVAALAAGFSHDVTLKANGTVTAWGNRSYTNVPSDLTNVIAIEAGPYLCMALRADGKVFAWGDSSYGQTSVPSTVSNAIAIAAGRQHSLALKADGTIQQWGTSSDPVPLGLSNVIAIAAGTYHSLALKDDGTVVTWAATSTGQTVVPEGLTNVVAIKGGSAGSSLALLGDGPPFLTTPLIDRAALFNPNVDLYIAATGARPLSYQWRFAGTNLPGATNAVLTLSNLQKNETRDYSVAVSNSLGGVTSRIMRLTVVALVITNQPRSQGVPVNSGATLSVGAMAIPGVSLSYQWKKDGIDITDATNASYVITSVQKTNDGVYTVDVCNPTETVTSSNAVLRVIGPYTFGTLAGLAGSSGTNDGVGSAARFNEPAGIAVDGDGNIYVCEYRNQTVRKITPDGTVTTLAGLAGVAGWNDGVGSAARFDSPEGIALDSAGNLYVADNVASTIRKITPAGTVSTLAGKPRAWGLQNGTGDAARFDGPNAVVVDTAGNLFVSEYGNEDVRKITPACVVTTVAGGFANASGIAMDGFGNLYVTEQGDSAIRKVTMPAGTKSLFANVPGPYGGAMDSLGDLFLAGKGDHTVRMVSAVGTLYTLTGLSGAAGSADGMGSTARFYSYRSGIAIDGKGNLYVADNRNHTIRKGVPFAVTTLPQNQAVPAGTSVALNVGAEGGSYSYQWSFGGVPLPGQTNTSLPIGALWRTNTGVYSVLVSNTIGNWITFNATVRALVTPVIRTPQVATNGPVRLLFQDSDGGIPYDLSQVVVQWRTNLPSGTDTNWQTVTSPLVLTNGFVAIDDTNAPTRPASFYRILEK